MIRMTRVLPPPLPREENGCGVRHYNSCGKDYKGETARELGKRLGEHQKQTTSALWEHQSKGKIKEAIHIRRQRPILNRYRVYELPAIFNQFLSREQIHRSHVTTLKTVFTDEDCGETVESNASTSVDLETRVLHTTANTRCTFISTHVPFQQYQTHERGHPLHRYSLDVDTSSLLIKHARN